MKVSILLPTFNGEIFLREAVNSVISQSFDDYELIIINDGSKDNTREIINQIAKSDKRIVCINNDINRGLQKTLNRGLKRARGEYIARMDDDDIWIDTDKLKEQVAFFNNHKNYVLIGTGCKFVDNNKNELYNYLPPTSDAEIRKIILGKNIFIHPAVMFRKEIVAKIGGYSDSKKVLHVEDYELWLKMGTMGKMANFPNTAVQVVRRADSITHQNILLQQKNALILSIKYKNYYPNNKINILKRVLSFFIYGCCRISPFSKIKINTWNTCE